MKNLFIRVPVCCVAISRAILGRIFRVALSVSILPATLLADFRWRLSFCVSSLICFNPFLGFGYFLNAVSPFYPVIQGFVSSIGGLFFSCHPFAIFKRVVSIIIDPIKGKPVWSWGHIKKKFLKRFSPFGTNTNASAAIPLVVFIGRVKAPLYHCVPHIIKRSSRESVSSYSHVNPQIQEYTT